MKRILILISVFVCVLYSPCFAATYYVDDDAINNSGNGLTSGTAKHNITAALALCGSSGGDMVIILDGIYDEELDMIQQTDLPSSATAYTTIKAQNRWGVEIQQKLGCNRDQTGRNYVYLDGLRFTALNKNSFNGSNWKITNCAFYGSLAMGNSFQEYYDVHSNNILIEDCHVWGPGGENTLRYKVSAQSCSNVIWRRVVARHDGGYTSPGNENPSAVFMVYSSEHVRLQNCIAIDSPGQTNDDWSAGFYTADHQGNYELYFQDVRWEGCIAMNIDNTISFNLDNAHDFNGYDTVYDNCVVLNGYSRGFYSNAKVYLTDKIIYNQCSVINVNNNGFESASSGEYDKTVQYSIMLNLGGSAIGNNVDHTNYNNAYGCGTNNPGTNGFTTNPGQNGLLYPLRIESGSNLETAGGGTRVGAHIVNQWGATGTMWGDTEYDTITTTSLWPFANEAQIKDDFTSINNGSDEARGFCADGQSLTKYIWEYLGDTIPPGMGNDDDSVTLPSLEDLSDVEVSPNPFKPGRGDSIMRFTNLSGNPEIRIYTVSGELVKKISKEVIGSNPTIEWDVRNAQGENLVSGVYVYCIVNEQGTKKYGKFTIIK